MSQITQKDIAEALNVSRETVTKALSGDPKVSIRTREAVVEKAVALGYTPNFLASSLASRRARLIGLVLPKIAHSFFSTIAEGVYRECRRRDYTVIPMISFENLQNEENNIRSLLSMRIAGLVICMTRLGANRRVYSMLREHDIPVVFFDRVFDEPGFPRVVTDNRTMAFKAVGYALMRGYKRPACLSGLTGVNVGAERRLGFLDALEEFGFDTAQALIRECETTREDGYLKSAEMLRAADRPDFILAVNDNVAHGVYDAARELGISIPDELGVIGFGNLEFGEVLSPGLTTVDISTSRMSRTIADLILRAISGEPVPSEVVIPGELIVRGSCR